MLEGEQKHQTCTNKGKDKNIRSTNIQKKSVKNKTKAKQQDQYSGPAEYCCPWSHAHPRGGHAPTQSGQKREDHPGNWQQWWKTTNQMT
jgi:hypothetical protein